MPSDCSAVLLDLKHHIDLASGFVAGMTFEFFECDVRTQFAVTRCLEIISESSRRLPDELTLQVAEAPNYIISLSIS